MPRKCCTMWDGEPCRTNYDLTKKFDAEKTTVHRFPKPPKQDRWVRSLPNTLSSDLFDEKGVVSRNIGVCVKHWPSGCETKTVQGDTSRPIDPPSVFGNTDSLCFTQSLVTPVRSVEERAVTAESRAARESLRDQIPSWNDVVKYCKKFERDLIVKSENTSLKIFKLSGEPPDVEFSVFIHNDFRVDAYRRKKKIVLRDIIDGFSNRVNKFSQIDAIISRLNAKPIDMHSELRAMGNNILNVCSYDGEKKQRQLSFIGKQLLALEAKPQGRRYSAESMMEAIDLYLRSRNTYRALRELLVLPSRNIVYEYFEKLGPAGSLEDSNKSVKKVLESLSEKQRKCFISFDEVHIKPGLHYQGKYVLGNAMNVESDCPETKMLALMVNPSFGAPAFVARLIPVHNLKADFLYEQLMLLVNSIHEAGGYVFALMSDNLKVNQKCFRLFHENFTSLNIFSVAHPVPNDKFPALFTLYDPTHLFKNIRNNWVTEKTQTLDFCCPDTGVQVSAKWNDLITIYKTTSDEGDLSNTKLDYQTLFPNNFEKQKVHLVVNVFNEKTYVVLSQRNMNGTLIFVKSVTKMWHIMNIKSFDAGFNLNDRNRDVIRDPNDNRLKYLEAMATSFKKMDNSVVGHRVRGLTADTGNALHQTLNGFVELTKTLLLSDHQYVMPGKIQSDRLEGEFGIFRQSCGGNYMMSAEQVVSSLQLQRLKLFSKLDIHMEDSSDNVCCENVLVDSEEDLDLVERCFEESSNLSMTEKSTLFYMSGYVARKEGIPCSDVNTSALPESEFTDKLSRGKLSFPPHDLYDLSLYLYSFFKLRKDKCCTKIYLEAFHEIYLFTGCDFPNERSINRRFANCFFKAFTNKANDKIKADKDKKAIKRRRLNNQ